MRNKSSALGVPGSTEVDAQLAERLGLLFSWSRIQFYELMAERARIQIDTSAFVILGALAHSSPIRTSDLAASMGLDGSTVSRHVAKVIDRGWAVRSADATDGRAALVSLTREGKKVRQQLWREWVNLLHESIENWAPEECEQFLALMTRLTTRLSEILTTTS